MHVVVCTREERDCEVLTCNASSNEQWSEFCEHTDSVAFISWCADKIAYWSSPGFAKYTIQAPLYNRMTERPSSKITSPDDRTDWTLTIWHVCHDTKCTVPFTKDILQKIEAVLARVKYRKMRL